MKKYKYITIKHADGELWQEKPLFRILNNSNNEELGNIFYWKQWKKYVFTAKNGIVFDSKCLMCILDFLQNRTKIK